MQYFSRLLTSGQENLPPDSLHALCTMLSAFCPRPLCHPIHNQPHVNPGEAWFHYQHKIDCRRKVITWFLSKHCLFTFPWVLVLSEVEVLVIGYWSISISASWQNLLLFLGYCLLKDSKICLLTKPLTFPWLKTPSPCTIICCTVNLFVQVSRLECNMLLVSWRAGKNVCLLTKPLTFPWLLVIGYWIKVISVSWQNF